MHFVHRTSSFAVIVKRKSAPGQKSSYVRSTDKRHKIPFKANFMPKNSYFMHFYHRMNSFAVIVKRKLAPKPKPVTPQSM